MTNSFEATYSRMTDEELLHLADEQELLRDDAKQALALEFIKRGLQPSSPSGRSGEEKQPASQENPLAAIFGRISLGWQRMMRPPLPDERYRGIRGWLQVLVLYLVIVYPLGLVLALPLWRADRSVLAGSLIPWAPWAIFAGRSFVILVGALGLYAGISMWRNWPGALRLAKLYFALMVLNGVVGLVFPRFILPLFIPSWPALTRWDANSVGVVVLLNALSFVYLIKSKRVSSTFRQGP